MHGNIGMVKLLLTQGAKISSSALAWSLTGLEDGPVEKHRQICEILVHHGADLNPDMRTTGVHSPRNLRYSDKGSEAIVWDELAFCLQMTILGHTAYEVFVFSISIFNTDIFIINIGVFIFDIGIFNIGIIVNVGVFIFDIGVFDIDILIFDVGVLNIVFVVNVGVFIFDVGVFNIGQFIICVTPLFMIDLSTVECFIKLLINIGLPIKLSLKHFIVKFFVVGPFVGCLSISYSTQTTS
ncbi:hypothetical protein BJX76DRAFT_355365 [Aspergillus varians]